MNIKEAIEFLEYIHTIASEDYNEESVEKRNQIVNLLKRGEKFEQMWGEFEIYIEGKSEALTNKMNILWKKYIIGKEVKNAN